jgi:anti-sigma factor RsiW
MRASGPEPHTLAGAYAMDALDGLDQARFERHLARCQECSREVTGLREATARLAVAAAAQPPAALKELLRAETARTRQLPPDTRSTPAASTHHRDRAVPTGSKHGRTRLRVWAPRLALALAGALVVATLTFRAAGTAGQPPLAQQPLRSGAIAAVLSAPDARMLTARVKTGGTATVVMSHHERMLVFTAAGLRALPASQCYELWLIEPGLDRPAGLLPMLSHGTAGPVIASGLQSREQLGLTVEPASGTRHPTSAMIMVLTL